MYSETDGGNKQVKNYWIQGVGNGLIIQLVFERILCFLEESMSKAEIDK